MAQEINMKPIAIIASLLLIAMHLNSFACSCIGQRSVEEEIKHSDAVVVGKILSKEIITLTDSVLLTSFANNNSVTNSQIGKTKIVRYYILIDELYKGKIIGDTVTIYTGMGGGDCGINFKIGEKYIIYGEHETYFGQVNNDFVFPKGKNSYWTYSCLRTSIYDVVEISEIEKYASPKRKADKTAEFIGGKDSLMKFINTHFKYEKKGLCNYTSTVRVKFIIDEIGIFSTLTFVKPKSAEISLELIRVFKLMPKWIPATQNGKPIKSEESLSFVLNPIYTNN